MQQQEKNKIDILVKQRPLKSKAQGNHTQVSLTRELVLIVASIWNNSAHVLGPIRLLLEGHLLVLLVVLLLLSLCRADNPEQRPCLEDGLVRRRLLARPGVWARPVVRGKYDPARSGARKGTGRESWKRASGGNSTVATTPIVRHRPSPIFSSGDTQVGVPVEAGLSEGREVVGE